MDSTRIEYLDIAKGIGIFLVVIGHFINQNSYPGIIIYSFHMPLFFFLSGLCFNENKYSSFKFLFISRLRTVLWPCFCFTVIISFLQSFLIDIPLSDLKNELPGALWFLPVLFLAEIMYYPLYKIGFLHRLILILLLYLVGLYYAGCLQGLPYKISFLPKAILYYGTGHSLKDFVLARIKNMGKYTGRKHYSLIAVSLSVMLLFPFINNGDNGLCTAILSIEFAVLGIYTTFLVSTSNVAKMKRWLVYLGQNTLVIMAVHVFFMRLCLYYIHPVITYYIVYKILEFVIVWCMSLLCVIVANRHAPLLKRI